MMQGKARFRVVLHDQIMRKPRSQHVRSAEGEHQGCMESYCLLLKSGAIKPIVAKTFPLVEAVDALRYLIEGRPFGRVVLTI